VRLYAGAGFDSGGILAVEGNEGYAMWLPPGVHSDEAGIADLLRQSVAATRLTEILDLVAQMTSFQPAEPHWFLPLIGVDSINRGRGRDGSDRIVDPPVDRGRSLRNRAVAGYGCNCYGGGGVGGVLSIVPIVVLVR
jgi:hypothetical protein